MEDEKRKLLLLLMVFLLIITGLQALNPDTKSFSNSDNPKLANQYDFIIVGAGSAGENSFILQIPWLTY